MRRKKAKCEICETPMHKSFFCLSASGPVVSHLIFLFYSTKSNPHYLSQLLPCLMTVDFIYHFAQANFITIEVKHSGLNIFWTRGPEKPNKLLLAAPLMNKMNTRVGRY